MGPWESRSYRTREFDLNALEGNFANVPPDLRGTIRSRMAECARLSGWYRLRVGERSVARKLLAKSLRYKWHQPKVAAYLAATFLPIPVLRMES